jgi:N-acetylglucosaminyl-diphospho-decaprenol L-rhamnosyltransferase
MAGVDVVIVSFNSRDHLRRALEPLVGRAELNVIVVDNASTDGTLATIEDTPVQIIPLSQNGGFAHGCNEGWRRGGAPYVLFLNPDTEIDFPSIERLRAVFEANERVGIAAPQIRGEDGVLHFSQRRFPHLRSTFSQALFLHRFFPRADWADELVRDERAYARRGSPEWVSGACFMVSRPALERLGGLDEGFFMYCEDTDFCRRLWDAGLEVRYEPDALVRHVGGASVPRGELLPVLASSRVRYAWKHHGPVAAALERFGIALGALTHLLLARSSTTRAGHARSLRSLVSRSRSRTWPVG